MIKKKDNRENFCIATFGKTGAGKLSCTWISVRGIIFYGRRGCDSCEWKVVEQFIADERIVRVELSRFVLFYNV